MSVETQLINPSQHTYYVMNLHNDRWTKISECFFNLEEAKQVYSHLLKEYPFARIGGSQTRVVTEND